MNYRISRGKIFKWIALAVSALIAMRLFFVQQLIAAFLIFSVLFACIATVVLIVFVLDRVVQIAFARGEIYLKAFGRAVRRAWEPAEGLAETRMFQFDRLAAQPLPRTTNSMGREGRRISQITHDAYVRGDLTPLSTKVADIVRAVSVAEFQKVSNGDGHRHNPAR
jgi:DNA-binding protein